MSQLTIGQRIKFLMEAESLSIRAFARAIDAADTNIRNYIDKGTKPSSDVVEKILRVFPRTNPSWLIIGDGDPFRPDSGHVNDHFINYQKNISGNAIGSNHGTATNNSYTIADCEKERDTYKAERDLARAELAGLRQQLEMAQALIEAHKETISLLRGGYNRPN